MGWEKSNVCNGSLQFFWNLLFTFTDLKQEVLKFCCHGDAYSHCIHKKQVIATLHLSKETKLANFIKATNEFHTYLIHFTTEVILNEVKNMTLKQP